MIIRLALVTMPLLISTAVWAAEEPVRFELRALPGLMKYDQTVLRVKPGQNVEITLRNEDQLPHNLVVLKDSGHFMEVAQKAWELGPQGPPSHWIPDDPRILAHTAMIDPGQSGQVNFAAPTEEGAMDIVCTFPGHAMIMNGKIQVSAAASPGLRELTCMVFKGDWDRLPDFLRLPANHKVGVDEVADNLINLEVTPLRDHFGLVFNGLLDVPSDGQYTFFLGSDDGSRLLIDDGEIINNDSVHAYTQKRKRVRLQAGVRRVKVEYFEQAGEQNLTLAWSGPGFNRVWLSSQTQAVGEEMPEILLSPSDGRPVVYRGFLSPNSGSRRLIAVGMPEQLNYAFDQDQFRLALLWKGAFLDVGRHWTGRGAGDVGPLGFGVVERPPGPDWAIISDEQQWPVPDEFGRVGRGKFRGYRLDGKGQPTFRYLLDGLEVEESLHATGDLARAKEALVRTLVLRGDPGTRGLHFRLGPGSEVVQGVDGMWKLTGNMAVGAEGGGKPVMRDGWLVVPVPLDGGEARLVVTYRWF